MYSKKPDTSRELHVYRYAHGIKLIRPNSNCMNNGYFTRQTVASLHNLPCSIYFDDVNGIIQSLNDNNAEMCGFNSTNHAIGKSYFERLTSQTAYALLANDKNVMAKEKMEFHEEIIQQSDQIDEQHLISIKMPWYDKNNKVIGLCGFSIILNKNPLAESLTAITNLGLLYALPKLKSVNAQKLLPTQQRICAEYLLKGLSYKEIANKMHLSPRTIESYVNCLKDKFNCKNKYELVIKLSEVIIN